jgi:gas vesicle protein
MDDKIKAAIQQSMKEIEEIQGNFDKLVEDLPEHTKVVRERTAATLKTIRTKLDEAMKEAGDEAQEAQVQAHLGVMEAQDRLEASRKVVDDYLGQWQDKSKSYMDEATLKAHLATMEAQDFWDRRGKHLMEEFKQSQKSMQSLATMAVSEMQEQFGRWNTIFNDIQKSATKDPKDKPDTK